MMLSSNKLQTKKFNKPTEETKKKITRQILGNEARQAMTALKDSETNAIHTEPAALKHYVHDYFTHQATLQQEVPKHVNFY